MTSAPKSAMMVVDTGPAMKLAASITRIPSRRRVMVRAPPVGRPVTRAGDGMRRGREYRDWLGGGAGPRPSAPHGRHDLPEDLRDRAPDLRVVVCAGSDHDRQIEFGHDKEPLPAVAEARAPREFLPLPIDGACPPLIAVAEAVAGGHVRTQRLRHPVGRHDLPSLPL